MPVRAMDRGPDRYAEARRSELGCSGFGSAGVNSLFGRGMQTIQVVCCDSAPTDLSFLSPPKPSRFQSVAFNFRRSSSNSRWIRSRSAWAANCAAFASLKALF